jgi:glycosyltransferase involved in cell wall biosynthesis
MIEQKETPLVSFVITYYNQPVQLLCECIDSILALSLRSFEREIIVIDDGSEVCPMNGLMQYGNDIVYVRQKNQGVSTARNRGMNMATGKFIQFIDADDYLIQSPYEHCLDLLRLNSDIEMVMFDFTHSASLQDNIVQSPIKTSGTAYMRNHNIAGTVCCFIFRQSILGKLAFSPEIKYGEDEEFTAQLLLRAEEVYVTKAKAYFYRCYKNSAIQQSRTEETGKKKRLEDNLSVILHLQNLCDKLPQNDRLALQRRVAQLTMDYIYNTITLTHSRQALNSCLDELSSKGLFPLPDRDYTRKYTWFRRMTNSAVGRTLLLHSLPLLKREK